MDNENVVFTQRTIYYSTVKKNAMLLFAMKRLKLGAVGTRNTILSEISQTQKYKYHMFFPQMCELAEGRVMIIQDREGYAGGRCGKKEG